MSELIQSLAPITDSNQDGYAELHAELHDSLRILRKIETMLDRFGPLLEQFTAAPGPTMLAGRRAMRRAAR